MLRPLFAALLAISVTSVAALPSSSLADERCQELESLHAQYAGVKLTPKQERLKRKLVAWYYGHCRGRHVAGAE